jgi:quercetin dioxygenase-like cupin family protein
MAGPMATSPTGNIGRFNSRDGRSLMHIVSLDKVTKVKPDMAGAEGVFKQVPIGRADGTPAYSFRVFTIEPGGHTPLHRHPFEHLNYIIQGQGTLVAGDGEHPVEKGDFALVPADETHQYRNRSASEPLLMICAVPKEYE